MNRSRTALAGVASLLLFVGAAPTTTPAPSIQFPKIDRRPTAADYTRMRKPPTEVPVPRNPKDGFEIDFRSTDVHALDFTSALPTLAAASFDSLTRWPEPQKFPSAFIPARVLDLGKDPGLGVRALHARGITGKGVGLAIVDQTLLTDHVEYAGRLRFYEELGIFPLSSSEMHGPAVASAAVGKTCGVAPEADLYYIAARAGEMNLTTRQFKRDFTLYAKAVRRLLAVNQSLPQAQRIRVISLSIGWDPSEAGYDDINAAVKEAKSQGILVTSSSLEETYGFRFHGLFRPYDADPNDFAAYRPGSWWAERFFARPADAWMARRLLVPMDHRTLAGPCSTSDYAHYSSGGWSWCTPYIAGVYALACQVTPTITPDAFWAAAVRTGKTIRFDHDGKKYTFGPILNPPSLIDSLASKETVN